MYSRKVNNDKIIDFSDSLLFKKNKLFKNDPHALQIQLYFDEFTTTNGLNNNAISYSVGDIYFIVGNLNRKYKSNLDNIHLALLCETKFIKQYGLATLLKPLIEDLRILESDGIKFNCAGVFHHLFGSISFISADNLASHEIGCYFKGFSRGLRTCRSCMVTHSTLGCLFTEENFQLRTRNV